MARGRPSLVRERFEAIRPLFEHSDAIPNPRVGSVPPWCALISSTYAARRWGTTQPYAWKILQTMVAKGLLVVVKPGTRGRGGRPAIYGLSESEK